MYTGFTITQQKSIGRITAKFTVVSASSRLAIITNIRMLCQGGLTGSAWEIRALREDSGRRREQSAAAREVFEARYSREHALSSWCAALLSIARK